MTFVTDELLVVVGQSDKPVEPLYSVELWYLTNPNKHFVSTVWEGSQAVRHLSVSSSGDYLAISTKENQIHVVPITLAAIQCMASAKIGRDFNDNERITYGLNVRTALPRASRRSED